VIGAIGDVTRFQTPRSWWPISAWTRGFANPARSPRATGTSQTAGIRRPAPAGRGRVASDPHSSASARSESACVRTARCADRRRRARAKLLVLCWHLLIKDQDYAFARPSSRARGPGAFSCSPALHHARVASWARGRDPGGLHQPLDALSADADAVRQAQLGVDARRIIDPALGRWIALIFSVSHASVSARSDGARRSHSWKLMRLTSRARHIRATGKLAF
jgi:hypothetical protein